MTENKTLSKKEWIDPDDAPELTDEIMDRADWYFGKTLIRRGRPRTDSPKISTTLRLDADVIDQFKAKGPGWQTRINLALREWLKQAG